METLETARPLRPFEIRFRRALSGNRRPNRSPTASGFTTHLGCDRAWRDDVAKTIHETANESHAPRRCSGRPRDVWRTAPQFHGRLLPRLSIACRISLRSTMHSANMRVSSALK